MGHHWRRGALSEKKPNLRRQNGDECRRGGGRASWRRRQLGAVSLGSVFDMGQAVRRSVVPASRLGSSPCRRATLERGPFLARLDRVSSRLPTATCRRLPRTHRSWCGRITMRFSGRREDRRSCARAGPCLCGGLHPASSSDRTRSPRGGPPPGAGAERKSRNLLSSESARFNSMVIVAEHDDAGMRRRARRDQNDREEKAETMRHRLIPFKRNLLLISEQPLPNTELFTA